MNCTITVLSFIYFFALVIILPNLAKIHVKLIISNNNNETYVYQFNYVNYCTNTFISGGGSNMWWKNTIKLKSSWLWNAALHSVDMLINSGSISSWVNFILAIAYDCSDFAAAISHLYIYIYLYSISLNIP